MSRPALTGTRARAFDLFCKGMQQKEIAAEVGVTEKTIVAWKKQDDWLTLRGNATLAATGKVPAWGLRVLKLLDEQQAELQALRATVAQLTSQK